MVNKKSSVVKDILMLKLILFLLLASSFFVLNTKTSRADYMTSAQCNAQGGSCNWISNYCNSDQDVVGLCQGGPLAQGACCKKRLLDTSGADPDPIGAGAGAGGVLPDPKAGGGGTVTPGTSGIPTTSSSANSTTSSGLVPCTNKCTLCHLVVGFKNIFDFLIGLLFVATMLTITISGVFYMVSAGSKSTTEAAKKALTYALTAFIVGMGAWLIINTVMVGFGFKHPYGGNWWEFTCDTTQTKGPVTPGGGGGGGSGTPAGTATPDSEQCKPNFGVAGSLGCSGSDCVSVNNLTSSHGCESNGGNCLMSQGAASQAQQFVNTFNNLAAGKNCSLKVSSTIQGPSGPSVSSCHKTGTCADFNIAGDYNTCAPLFYQAAKESGAVQSYLNEYAQSGCPLPGSRTGNNIHVNF